MKLALVLSFPFVMACGGAADDDDDLPPPTTGLDRCTGLAPLWDVSNLHGEIVSMTIAGDGTVVLGTADGAVKTWSIGADAGSAPLAGGRPSYGDPLTELGAPARALALGTASGSLLAADDGAAIREWTLPEASPGRAVQLDGSPSTALVARSATEVIVADADFAGRMRVVDLDTGVAGAEFATTLWGVSAFEGAGASFYVVGHNYDMAAVERRTLAEPEAVADLWDPHTLPGPIAAAAVSADGAWLVTGGEGHVLVFDANDLAAGPVATATVTAADVAITRSGAHVAAALDGRVALFTRDLAAEVASIEVPSPVAVGIDPSGERLIVASADGRLRAFGCP